MVVAACGHPDLIFGDLVDEPVLVGDPAGPVALEPMFEWLGCADALVAVAFDVLDQGVDPFEDLPVLGLPPQVVPGVLVPDQLHSTRSRAVPLPDSSRSIEVSRRRPFSGLRSRYAVSFSDS